MAAPIVARHVVDDVQRYQTKLDDYVSKVEAYAPKPAAIKPPIPVEHSGPQGNVKPLTVINDPADWTAKTWAGREEEFTYSFTPDDVEELTDAVTAIKRRFGRPLTEEDVQGLTKEDFHLPKLAAKFVELVKNNVSSGRGFQLVRHFPVEVYEKDREGLVLAFWALALVLGRPLVSQTDYHADGTVFGSLLNHVTRGRWSAEYKDGPYQRVTGIDNNRLAFHSDQGATDVIALLSITAAKEGGESKWVSGIAIHNELLRRGRKDLVQELSRLGAWLVPKKHDQAAYIRKPDGSFEGFEDSPPFEYHDGYLSVHFASYNYQEIELTPLQEEAIWSFAALAESPDFFLSKKLAKGDIEIIHNPTILHSRTEVVDGQDDKEKRHLLRWWVHSDATTRPIAKHYAPRSNVQAKGGFTVPEGSKLRLPFFPYSRHDGLGISSAKPAA